MTLWDEPSSGHVIRTELAASSSSRATRQPSDPLVDIVRASFEARDALPRLRSEEHFVFRTALASTHEASFRVVRWAVTPGSGTEDRRRRLEAAVARVLPTTSHRCAAADTAAVARQRARDIGRGVAGVTDAC